MTHAMDARLTNRQQKFVQAVIAGKTINQAYAAAGYKPNEGNASRLKGIDKIQSQIRQAQMKAAAKMEHTAASIAQELDEIRILAIDDKQYAAAVAAVLGKAKVLGLIVDRKEVEILHKPAPLPTKAIELDEDEWKRQFAKPLMLQANEAIEKAAAAGEDAGAVARDAGLSRSDVKVLDRLDKARAHGKRQAKRSVGTSVGIARSRR